MTKEEKNRQRVLNGGRGGGEAYRRLFEYYENKVYFLNEQITELKKQIEKMKCCENCKHSDTECEGYTICSIGHYDDCLSNKVLYHTTDEKDYWEINEND